MHSYRYKPTSSRKRSRSVEEDDKAGHGDPTAKNEGEGDSSRADDGCLEALPLRGGP
jgi:hypothetical protein